MNFRVYVYFKYSTTILLRNPLPAIHFCIAWFLYSNEINIRYIYSWLKIFHHLFLNDEFGQSVATHKYGVRLLRCLTYKMSCISFLFCNQSSNCCSFKHLVPGVHKYFSLDLSFLTKLNFSMNVSLLILVL